MLMCVAREKSPIASEEAMSPVWYLPQGEEEAPDAVRLPGRSRSLALPGQGVAGQQAGHVERQAPTR
jgi:hypothetical protein